MEPWSLTNVGGLLHIIDLRFDHCLAAQTEKGRCWHFDASGVFCGRKFHALGAMVEREPVKL